MFYRSVDTNSSFDHQNWSIQITDLTHHYGSSRQATRALHNINLTIESGVFGLLGRNGAGKTTLLNILATLLQPTHGNVTIGSYNTKHDRWHIRPLLGFLPQDLGFYPRLTVQDTLHYLATLQGLTNINKEIDYVLDAVNLQEKRRARVGSLSGGMRRRLGLAQALMGNPRVLIVDEPTAGLDPVEQQRFRMLLGTLGSQPGRTIILSTHIVADIATIARHIAVLEKGKLLFHGTTTELRKQAEGKIWLWASTIEQVENSNQKNAPFIITSISPDTTIQNTPDAIIARVIGANPGKTAISTEATLEDGYFSLIGRGDQ